MPDWPESREEKGLVPLLPYLTCTLQGVSQLEGSKTLHLDSKPKSGSVTAKLGNACGVFPPIIARGFSLQPSHQTNKNQPPKQRGYLKPHPGWLHFFSSSFARAGILSAVRDWWRAHPHAGALQPLQLLLGLPTGVPGSCWGPGQLCTWQEGIQGGGSKSSASMPKSLKTHELGSI